MPRTQQQRNDETRRALLEAGWSLLSEVGYDRTSVAQIAQRANRAHGTFYLHFANKQAFISVLLEEMAEEARQHVRDLSRTTPNVEAVWLTFRDFLARATPGRSLWLLIDEVVAVDETAAPLRSKLRQLYVAPILRALERRRDDPTAEQRQLELLADILTSMGLHFARTGTLPASPEVVALHMTIVWFSALGDPLSESDLDTLRGRLATTPS